MQTNLLAKKVGTTKKGQTVGVGYIHRDELTKRCLAHIANGMTQKDAALKEGISPPTLCRWRAQYMRAKRP